MPKVLVVSEWFDSAIALRGANTHILAAWFGVAGDRERAVNVKEQLERQLQEDGMVWLSASIWQFPDPARFQQKQLLVVFEGESEAQNESFLWSATAAVSRSLALKFAVNALVLAAFGPAATSAALAASASSASATVAVAAPLLLRAGVGLCAGYRAYRKCRGEAIRCGCAICMEDEVSEGKPVVRNLIRLSCTHTFHEECIQDWMEQNHRQGLDMTCPECRQVPSSFAHVTLEDGSHAGLHSAEVTFHGTSRLETMFGAASAHAANAVSAGKNAISFVEVGDHATNLLQTASTVETAEPAANLLEAASTIGAMGEHVDTTASIAESAWLLFFM